MGTQHAEFTAKAIVTNARRGDKYEGMLDLPGWESAVSAGLLPISLQLAERWQDEPPQILSRFRRISTLRAAQMSVRGVIAQPRLGNGTQLDYLKILFMTKGKSRILGANSDVALDAGMWTVYNPARSYQLDPVEPYECIALALPARIFPVAERWATGPTRSAFPIRGNISLALQSIILYLDGPEEFDVLEESAAASAIVTLLRSGFGRLAGTSVDAPVPADVALRARIDAEIAAQSSDPDFTVERLAERLGVSRRTLYNAFGSESSTPYSAIFAHRLEASGRALSDLTLRHRSVTEIALDAGFPDSAHFARAFKRHFGVTPTAYRRYFLDN